MNAHVHDQTSLLIAFDATNRTNLKIDFVFRSIGFGLRVRFHVFANGWLPVKALSAGVAKEWICDSKMIEATY